MSASAGLIHAPIPAGVTRPWFEKILNRTHDINHPYSVSLCQVYQKKIAIGQFDPKRAIPATRKFKFHLNDFILKMVENAGPGSVREGSNSPLSDRIKKITDLITHMPLSLNRTR